MSKIIIIFGYPVKIKLLKSFSVADPFSYIKKKIEELRRERSQQLETGTSVSDEEIQEYSDYMDEAQQNFKRATEEFKRKLRR